MTHDEAIRNVLQTDRERVLVDTFSVAIRDLHADYARRETQLAVAAAQAGADLVEETIEVHETRTTDAAPAVPAEFWQQ